MLSFLSVKTKTPANSLILQKLLKMPKKQSTSRPAGSKTPKSEGSKAPKPTPVITTKFVVTVNPLQPPVVAAESIPLTNIDYKIADPVIDFNLQDIHNWCYEKYLDKDDIPIWETHLPKYIVPLTHPGQEIIRLCQKYYDPDQRAIVNAEKEILFTITAQSINQMLQLQPDPQAVPLSIEALTQLYPCIDFPKSFMIFQNFMPSHVDIPKINPPYSTAKFPKGSRQIISTLSFILGYFTDEYTDELLLVSCPPCLLVNLQQSSLTMLVS